MPRLILPALFCFVLIFGCAPSPQSGRGFTLPKGDIEQGKVAFVDLQCHACHQVTGADFPAAEEGTDMAVRLGGSVPRIQTYGELVTSIINPSHRIAAGYAKEEVTKDDEGRESRMLNYNDVVTVQQLIDLVAFLQSRYELEEIEATEYPPYL